MGGACSAYGERGGVNRVLVRKPVGKRPLGRPRRRWGVNVKTVLQEVRCEFWTESNWFRTGTGGGHL